MFMQTFLNASALVLLNAFPAIAESTNSYYFEPIVSHLSGRLEYQKYPDAQPPYFEEGKDPEGNAAPLMNVLVLIPYGPINVFGTKCNCNNEDSFQNVRIIKIEDFTDPHDGQKYLGRHVQISGYLSERQTGFQYTDVLLNPLSVTVDTH